MQTTFPGALLAGSSDPQGVSGTSRQWRHSTEAGGTRLEAEQLTRAQNGDRTAFQALVLAHQAAVYSLAWRLLGVREDAQELAQDVFMLLHRYLGNITSAAHLRFWLRRTVCHRAIDRLRRRPPQPLVSLEAVAELEAPATGTDPLWHRHLRQFTAQLPMMPRAVLLLRYQEDLDPAEIARTLELPMNTVKSPQVASDGHAASERRTLWTLVLTDAFASSRRGSAGNSISEPAALRSDRPLCDMNLPLTRIVQSSHEATEAAGRSWDAAL